MTFGLGEARSAILITRIIINISVCIIFLRISIMLALIVNGKVTQQWEQLVAFNKEKKRKNHVGKKHKVCQQIFFTS